MNLIRVLHYHHRSDRHPGGRVIPHNQEYIELVTDGRGWVQSEGEWVEVTPGTLLWNKEGDSTIQRTDFEKPYSCFVIQFELNGYPSLPVPRISRWNNLDEIRQLTQEGLQLFIDENFDNQILLHYLIGRLSFQAQRYQWNQRRHDLPTPLKHVIQLIEKQYRDNLTLQHLAEESGWSVPHLHDMFRLHLEQSPYQFLLSRRIHTAKIRLASTQQPIKQIAMECGFSNPSTFSTAFRKQTGSSPAMYRRQNQHIH